LREEWDQHSLAWQRETLEMLVQEIRIDTATDAKPVPPERCTAEGCDRSGKLVRGLCGKHYSQARLAAVKQGTWKPLGMPKTASRFNPSRVKITWIE
jgi:hypothetical protein